MRDDVAIAKADTIRRCLRRVAEEYRGDPARLTDFTVQDSIVLNLQRACEAAIDLAMHAVAVRRLGVPQDARNAFALLAAAGVLSTETETRMKRMVGFRNIAVRDYRSLEVPVLAGILRHRLGDFEEFLRAVMGGG